METNNRPFSKPYGIKVAFAKNFAAFSIVAGKLYYEFDINGKWFSIPEVLGTLQPSVVSESQTKPLLYNVSITFRVALASIKNRNELEKYTRNKLIVQYTSGAGIQRVVGLRATPLQLTISEPEGFDGYECSITGSQSIAECFI